MYVWDIIIYIIFIPGFLFLLETIMVAIFVTCLAVFSYKLLKLSSIIVRSQLRSDYLQRNLHVRFE
jgi:hypothetical protein